MQEKKFEKSNLYLSVSGTEVVWREITGTEDEV